MTRYPTRYGKGVPSLDRCGRVVRQRSPVYLQGDELRGFADWKSGGRSRRHSTADYDTVERITRQAFRFEEDEGILGVLVGGALPGVGVGVASAVLRFVWPDRFCCVDWKNWFVLSFVRSELGEDNVLFGRALLKRLSSPYSSMGIRVSQYCEYLRVILIWQGESVKKKQAVLYVTCQQLKEEFTCE